MGNLAITNKAIDKFFGFLHKLDNNSKKRLIIKLTKSLEVGSPKKIDLKSLYGSWEDSRNADEIINEIRNSRVNIRNIAKF